MTTSTAAAVRPSGGRHRHRTDLLELTVTTNPQTAEERVAIHLAALDWDSATDANIEWSRRTPSFQESYRAAAREVIALVQSAVDQTTRDRIAEALSATDRQFLTFALDLAADQMASRGDEFDSDDEAAMQRLRRLADEAQPANLYAQSGIDTPGCDCGHAGMGLRWHGETCAWVAGLLAEARELLAKDEPAVGARQPDTETRPAWTPGPVALARAAEWAAKRQDATVDPAPAVAERPRCPHCQMPHDLGPGSSAVLACASIRASIADRDAPSAVPDRSAADTEAHVAPHCDGFPTTCPNPVTVPPAPPRHGGGIRCGCYDEESDRA